LPSSAAASGAQLLTTHIANCVHVATWPFSHVE